jgi:hypothetical protein
MSLEMIYLLGFLEYISMISSVFFIYDMINVAYRYKRVKVQNFFYGLLSWFPTFALMFFMNGN